MIVVILVFALIISVLIFYFITKNRLINQDYSNSLFYKNNEISYLIELNRNNHLSNLWPPILIFSSLFSLIIVFFFSNKSYNNFDFLFDFLIVDLLLFVPIFFTMTWFQAHWIRERDDLIEKELIRIKRELN